VGQSLFRAAAPWMKIPRDVPISRAGPLVFPWCLFLSLSYADRSTLVVVVRRRAMEARRQLRMEGRVGMNKPG